VGGEVNLGDVCVAAASALYLLAAIGYLYQGQPWMGLAFFCWATANGALVMIGKGAV